MSDWGCAWDPRKATANERKHGVRFEDAGTVFTDEHAFTVPDELHSTLEARFVTIGRAANRRMLTVVHTVPETGPWRLISARRALSRERRRYDCGPHAEGAYHAERA